MSEVDRRRFLQCAPLAMAGGYADVVFGKASGVAPKFAERPTFKPKGLFLTWQRDPTTSMTVQWVGSEAEGVQRSVWFAKKDSQLWRKQEHSTRGFPKTDHRIFRTELTGLEPG